MAGWLGRQHGHAVNDGIPELLADSAWHNSGSLQWEQPAAAEKVSNNMGDSARSLRLTLNRSPLASPGSPDGPLSSAGQTKMSLSQLANSSKNRVVN